MKMLRNNWPFLLAILLIVGLQQALSAAGIAYYMTQITMSACYVLVVVGLCLLMGYAGQVSLGHAGFFAIGGYTAAFLTTTNLYAYREDTCVSAMNAMGLLVEGQDLYGQPMLSVVPPAAFVVAIVIAMAAALVIGLPVLRLKGHYLAMATLGFGLIVYRIVLGADWFGQADGISSVPPLKLWGHLQVNSRKAFRVESYYIVWTAVMLAMVLSANLVRSRVGRALRAIHDNEEAAHSLGINTYRYKLAVFVLSGAMAAAGGVLATHFKGSIGPSEATAMYSVRYVAIVAVGGMANLWGGLFAAILLNFLSLRGTFGQHDDAVFGGILIAMMLFAPQGILPALRGPWKAWRQRRAVESEVAGGQHA